jgi:hypothetical protein
MGSLPHARTWSAVVLIPRAVVAVLRAGPDSTARAHGACSVSSQACNLTPEMELANF